MVGKFRSPPDTEKFPSLRTDFGSLEAQVERELRRIQFENHKEKEMVSFRRIILAIAGLALFTGLASAQVNTGGGPGSAAGPLTCTANVANPTQARSEGYAELLGDIAIFCTGGSALAVG